MKTDNDRVKKVIDDMSITSSQNWDTYVNTLDNNLPMIVYKLATAVGKRIRSKIADVQDLKRALVVPNSDIHNGVSLIINCGDEFTISVDSYMSPAMYVKNSKPIYDEQYRGKLNKYILLDDDVILTNSTLHSISLLNKYIDFVEKEEITENDIVNLFNYIVKITSKYVPIVKDIDGLIESQKHITQKVSRVSSDWYHVDIDLTHFELDCNHTALTTGAWDE